MAHTATSSVYSVPITPESRRPRSMIGTISNVSPESAPRTRPQSMMIPASQVPPRTRSRMSIASSTGARNDDGKTAVKVVVRVRPPLRASDPGYDLIPQRFQRSTVNVPTDSTLSVESSQGRKIFLFDRVFGEEVDQKGVWEYLQDSVDSFLQGYNVSILAYGQSGAGKSYTMGTSGSLEQADPTARGIIPRAAIHLFDSLGESTPSSNGRPLSSLKTPNTYSMSSMNALLQNAHIDMDKKWQMTVSYVEIYNEQPRDLLLPEGTSVHERAAVQIREDPKGRIFVEGLKTVPVTSVEELLSILNHGSAIRQTDATAINSRSSRSHAVFTVNLRQIRPQGPFAQSKGKNMSMSSEAGLTGPSSVTVDSKLHFVDLAGSERLKNTGATGDRAREGISINAGLASLGKVISQLSSKSAGGHVSYRDSKLTRMLQDSLGGNAITYMVACVTPAEFHLSETLNTVQYAQRARNIQSKPKIQQVSDEADKQAIIERLRTEVAFLRQQIRSADPGDRKPETSRERQTAGGVELQNQMLDMEQRYRALSERNAKLVAELTRNSLEDIDVSQETPAERLKRSQEAQANIKEIIAEYEMTIQSLESNLSTTRSNLAMTEGSLMERETKCAYIETMNQQLNVRIQKLMDREASTESYLHELESRLQDSTTGSEKHDTAVAELRREMARMRESESNAEDYISTLEERLAESEQDMEIMSREVDRLEQLVERQRSLGRLDNLLYELDNVHRANAKDAINGHGVPEAASVSHSSNSPSRSSSANDVHKRKQSEPMEIIQESRELVLSNGVDSADVISPKAPKKTLIDSEEPEPSPAQSKFMQEKFASVSQELFDLRLEHESAVNELDLMSAKYQEALRALAEMHGQLEDSNSGPAGTISPDPLSRSDSMSPDKDQDTPTDREPTHSRSLSSELSMAGESATSLGGPESINTAKETTSPDSGKEEISRLQTLLAEHQANLSAIKEDYTQLRQEHKDSLDTVERLRNEVSRSRSPMPSPSPHGVIRRPTSSLGQLGGHVDRGQRSIASLRTLLADELEDKPNHLEIAELHLTAATHELQSRMTRIQSLESDLQSVKKEMEMKSTIINGLTRERNSLKSGTPVDFSLVSQMRDQLIQKETELKTLHERYGQHEQELQAQVTAAKDQAEKLTASYEQATKTLEEQEQKLKLTTTELEVARERVDAVKALPAQTTAGSEISDHSVTAVATAAEREKYQNIIDELKKDLQQQTSTNASHTGKIEELTQMHEAASKDIHDHSQIIQEKCKEIELHKVKIATLNNKLKEAESAVEFHKHGLKSLHESHSNEIEEMKLSHAGMLAGYDDQIAELNVKHGKTLNIAENDRDTAKKELESALAAASKALGHDTSIDMLGNHITDIAEEKRHVFEANKRLVSTNAELEAQLTGRQNLVELEQAQDAANTKIANYQETIRNLANEVGNHEENIREKDKLIQKHDEQIKSLQADNRKKIALIEELEQQLQNSFEQHQKRMSVMQQQGSVALNEAQQRISALEKEISRGSIAEADEGKKPSTRPQSPATADGRSNSITSNLRKSASIASLPSPPPAIPLPPLPSIPTMVTATAGNPSPPQSRHTSKEVSVPPATSPTGVKDSVTIKRQSAMIEDQDNRLRTLEKHLHAEKQLTATLEEALVDLETQSNKLRVDAETWKKRVWSLEEEVQTARQESRSERLSMQQVQEEVNKRKAAEEARAQLEERMRVLKQSMDGRKKKKATLNCF